MTDMERERDYWRNVALYLADCHAATAESEGRLKGTSKYQKKRYASICQKALDLIEKPNPFCPPYWLTHSFSLEERQKRIVERCKRGTTCNE